MKLATSLRLQVVKKTQANFLFVAQKELTILCKISASTIIARRRNILREIVLNLLRKRK
jgi:hypothetical protein